MSTRLLVYGRINMDHHPKSNGFAAITLIIFAAVTSIIVTAATSSIIVNNLTASRFSQSLQAYYLAQSGLEEGIVNYLRNPNYPGGLKTFEDGTANITISADKKVMISTGTVGAFQRSIGTSLDYSGNLSVSSWKEIF
jgi:hypothetical protein